MLRSGFIIPFLCEDLQAEIDPFPENKNPEIHAWKSGFDLDNYVIEVVNSEWTLICFCTWTNLKPIKKAGPF